MSDNDNSEQITPGDIYREACATIRATDEISLKLLAFTPLFAGSAAGLLFNNADTLPPETTLFLVFLGMSATIALYVWERRNIQTCEFYRNRRDNLEAKRGCSTFANQPYPKLVPGVEVGKTGAERMLYAVSVAAWLVPVFPAVLTWLSTC